MELLERAARAGFAPGYAAAWWRRGDEEISVSCVGRSELAVERPVRRSTLFDLASLTKVLATTPLFLMSARERPGLLEVELGEVLEGLHRPLASLPIASLLDHSSGLPSWRPLYAMCEGDPSRLGEVLRGLSPDAGLGHRVAYSCLGYFLVGLVIETLEGRGIGELFDERIARPAGVEGRVVFRPRAEVAAGARSDVAELALCREMGWDPGLIPIHDDRLPDDGNARFAGGIAPNAGLFGTASAVIELGRELLAGRPSILLEGEEMELFGVNRTDGLEQHRAIGFQLSTSPGCSAGAALSPSAYGHTGFAGSSLWLDPECGLVACLLANRNHPACHDVDLHPLRRRFHALIAG